MMQVDKYSDSLFECFEIIALRAFSFESTRVIKNGYERCVIGADSLYFRAITTL
jgi:toxin ParE1/3/4